MIPGTRHTDRQTDRRREGRTDLRLLRCEINSCDTHIFLGWPIPNTTNTHHLQIRLPLKHPHPLQVQHFHQLTTSPHHSEYTHPLQAHRHQSSLSLSRGEGALGRCIDSMGCRGSCTQSAVRDAKHHSIQCFCVPQHYQSYTYSCVQVVPKDLWDLQSLTLLVTCYSNIVDRVAARSEGPAPSPMQQHRGSSHRRLGTIIVFTHAGWLYSYNPHTHVRMMIKR